jgi:hypothetical protein
MKCEPGYIDLILKRIIMLLFISDFEFKEILENIFLKIKVKTFKWCHIGPKCEEKNGTKLKGCIRAYYTPCEGRP